MDLANSSCRPAKQFITLYESDVDPLSWLEVGGINPPSEAASIGFRASVSAPTVGKTVPMVFNEPVDAVTDQLFRGHSLSDALGDTVAHGLVDISPILERAR
jgi:hypothetical protein